MLTHGRLSGWKTPGKPRKQFPAWIHSFGSHKTAISLFSYTRSTPGRLRASFSLTGPLSISIVPPDQPDTIKTSRGYARRLTRVHCFSPRQRSGEKEKYSTLPEQAVLKTIRRVDHCVGFQSHFTTERTENTEKT